MKYAAGNKFYRITSDLQMEVFELRFIEKGVYNFTDYRGKPVSFSQGVINKMTTSKRMAYYQLEEMIVDRYNECFKEIVLMQGEFLPGDTPERKVNLFRNRKGTPVYKYDASNGSFIEGYETIIEAAINTSKSKNPNSSSISQCCKGDRDTANGFKWSYSKMNNLFIGK